MQDRRRGRKRATHGQESANLRQVAHEEGQVPALSIEVDNIAPDDSKGQSERRTDTHLSAQRLYVESRLHAPSSFRFGGIGGSATEQFQMLRRVYGMGAYMVATGGKGPEPLDDDVLPTPSPRVDSADAEAAATAGGLEIFSQRLIVDIFLVGA